MKGLNATGQTGNWRDALGDPSDTTDDAAPAPALKGMADTAPPPSDTGGPMGFITDVLRNFNDKASFGLYPKMEDALFGGTRAQDAVAASEKNDPVASVLGSTIGYMVPVAGVDSAIVRTAPKLAENTALALMKRGAATNTATRVVDDSLRGNNPDPVGVGIDAAEGAAFGPAVHALDWAVSPASRVRAMGTTLSQGEKGTIANFIHNSAAQGIPLNVSEAAQATIPARTQDIRAAYDTNVLSPGGSQAAASFDAARTPQVTAAGRNVVQKLGGGISPIDVRNTAIDALEMQKGLGQAAAKPLYDYASTRKLPPTWVPQTPGVREAINNTADDPNVLWLLKQQMGRDPTPNDIGILDAVKKNISGDINTSAEKFPARATSLGMQNDMLTDKMDQVTPEYGQARDTAARFKTIDENLAAGPLGQIAKTVNTGAQGDALFGATNAADAATASDAIARMQMEQPGTPKGVLANRIDSAVSTAPLGFGKAALPNDYSSDLARIAAGPDFPDVSDTLAAARAVQPAQAPISSQGSYTPWEAAYSKIRDYGKGDITRIMQDPKALELMGIESPTQYGVTLAGNALTQAATDRRVRRSY